jgi:hypothetical protein
MYLTGFEIVMPDLEELPTHLGSFKCKQLEVLDIILEDTLQKGHSAPQNERLASSLESLRLQRLQVKRMLARSLSLLRPPTDEYLVGDLLQKFLVLISSLDRPGLLHVSFFHTPWIWPSTQILRALQQLELQVPDLVCDIHQHEIVFPTLR